MQYLGKALQINAFYLKYFFGDEGSIGITSPNGEIFKRRRRCGCLVYRNPSGVKTSVLTTKVCLVRKACLLEMGEINPRFLPETRCSWVAAQAALYFSVGPWLLDLSNFLWNPTRTQASSLQCLRLSANNFRYDTGSRNSEYSRLGAAFFRSVLRPCARWSGSIIT